MFIKIGEDRINVEQINTYLFNDKTKVLTICFLNDAVRIYHGATKLVQELDRVCNPKELKGLADEIKPIQIPVDNQCETCKYYENLMSDVPCDTCNADGNNWEAKDE